MTTYLRLRPECHLVMGASHGAIYDLLKGRLLELDGKAAAFILASEDGCAAEAAAEKAKMTANEAAESIENMVRNDYALASETSAYIERWRDRSMVKTVNFAEPPPVVRTAFLQISAACNLNCQFCMPDKTVRKRGCYGCSRIKVARDPLGLPEWSSLIRQLKQLDCRGIVVSGGNPLMAEALCSGVFTVAHQCKFEQVYLLTNGTGMSDAIIKQIAEQRIKVILQVYSHLAEVQDEISGRAGCYVEVMDNLRKLREANISVDFTLVISREKHKGVRESIAHYKAWATTGVVVTHAYANEDMVPQPFDNRFAVTRSSLNVGSVHDYFDRQRFHPCLNGTLAITPDGFLIPCPEMHDQVVGDLLAENIQEQFVRRRLDKYWQLTKDGISQCCKCEYRYACPDCRALQMKRSGNLLDATFCNYDISAGQWKHETVESR